MFVVRPTICQKNVEHGQFGEKWPMKDHGEKSSTNLHHRSSQAQLSNPHYQQALRAYVNSTFDLPRKVPVPSSGPQSCQSSTTFLESGQLALRLDQERGKEQMRQIILR